jgi:acyl-CoA synthetase (AMP-forming)/AMP-acid ligase II
MLDDKGPRPLTGTAMLELVARGAGALAERGVAAGDRVGLVMNTSVAFLAAFFGAWWLGAAAVPLAPPTMRQDAEHEAARLQRALNASHARLVVAMESARPLLETGPCPVLAPETLLVGAVHDRPADALALALIQFSSGSTGHPKGVALHDVHLQANAAAIGAVLQCGPDDVGISWLPLHHDMGLIGSLLYTQLAGVPTVLMPPDYFIRRPSRWLKAIAEYGGTLSNAPNFAYQLCAQLSPHGLDGLDLSRWKLALVGAEPIRAPMLEAFAARFAAHGFDPRAFVPTYGLAEATLAVAMTRSGEGATVDRIQRVTYEEDHVATPAGPSEADVREVVAVGPAMPGFGIEIRDPEGRALPERQVGEVCVQAPSLMAGYFEEPDATAAALENGWLHTGDLGYMAEGRLFISGRLKDLIIRGGCKYHPQDLEAIAEEHPAVRMGGASAFMVTDDPERPERVIVLVETRWTEEGPTALAETLRVNIFEGSGLRVDEVVPVAPQSLPKTTSGKIRRLEARRRYLAGEVVRVDG